MAGVTGVDAFNEGLDTANKTLDFLERLANLFGGLIDPCIRGFRSSLDKKSVVNELKRGLGEWKGEARTSTGRWLQPHLAQDVFERHLMTGGSNGNDENNGLLSPSQHTSCTAEFGWARFLYALNIRPGMGLINWQDPRDEKNPAVTGSVSLDLDCLNFCHITNLYQHYKPGRIVGFPYSFDFEEYKFPFDATLTVTSVEGVKDSHRLKFVNAGKVALSFDKAPFRVDMTDENGHREANLTPLVGSIKQWYEEALSYGVSPTNIQIVDVEKSSLEERVDSLLGAMAELRRKEWKNPYLVTPKWIEEASRVKRRVTTDNGKDTSLINWVIDKIKGDDEIKDRLIMALPPMKRSSWEREADLYLRGLCLFGKQSFEFHWSGGRDKNPSKQNAAFEEAVDDALPGILALLGNEPEGSWEKIQFESVPSAKVLEVMQLPRRIMNAAVVVLQPRPSDPVVIQVEDGEPQPLQDLRNYEILP